jgi:pilus assembly protein CpaB
MLSRNLLFGLGLLALLAGIMLAVLWFHRSAPPAAAIVKEIPTQSILLAAHPIAVGTLLRPGDMVWGDVPAPSVMAGDILKGGNTDMEFIGSVTRQAFAARERLIATALVKPGDRDFLVAALKSGDRAVSIAVDATQSTSGLVQPDDHVDVLLTQNFQQGTDAGHKSVGETVLRDLRVIAVDQTISLVGKPEVAAGNDAKMPKTITLEVTDRQAATLLVAEQLGKIDLALRAQADDQPATYHARDDPSPIWAFDVSRALPGPQSGASDASRATIDVIHGARTERLCQTSTGLAVCP